MTNERTPTGPSPAGSGTLPPGEGSGGNRFWDEATLVAYVDGELDAAGSRRVEALLAQDAEARAKVELMRGSARALHGAYDAAMTAPLPERLAALLASGERDGGADRPGTPASRSRGEAQILSWRRRTMNEKPVGRVWRLLPLAASLLLLAIGFAGGIAWRDIGAAPSLRLASGGEQPGTRAYEAALKEILDGGAVGDSKAYAAPDNAVSGSITLTGDFQAKGGMSCREFRREQIRSGGDAASGGSILESGIACRRPDGGWEVLTVPGGTNG